MKKVMDTDMDIDSLQKHQYVGATESQALKKWRYRASGT
jgi:hypothetical protein